MIGSLLSSLLFLQGVTYQIDLTGDKVREQVNVYLVPRPVVDIRNPDNHVYDLRVRITDSKTRESQSIIVQDSGRNIQSYGLSGFDRTIDAKDYLLDNIADLLFIVKGGRKVYVSYDGSRYVAYERQWNPLR